MPQNESPLRLGTRGSRLALVQAEMVRALLEANGTATEIVVVKTSGDRIQDRPLADAGGKGLFTKELEQALLGNTIDIAVHSMKDVPVRMPEGLAIGAILPREDTSDAFISRAAATPDKLDPGARVGTSSVRRHAQVARLRRDLEIVLLRGNVDTRLAKLDAGQYDAIILAFAGLKRLGLEARASSLLAPPQWLPALGQGAVGIQMRGADERASAAVARLNHRESEIALACERAFQQALDGSCRTPIAGLASVCGDRLTFAGEVLSPDGRDFAYTEFATSLEGCPSPVSAAHGRGYAAGLEIKPRAQRWLSF